MKRLLRLTAASAVMIAAEVHYFRAFDFGWFTAAGLIGAAPLGIFMLYPLTGVILEFIGGIRK